jgi:hypothetical protein
LNSDEGNTVQLRHIFAAVMLAIGACVLTPGAAYADTVLYDNSGFIQGQQSFVQSFDITTPGTLTVTLSNIPWLDTISDLNAFVSTPSSVLGNLTGSGTESITVGPGMIYAHWFGDAAGAYGLGVYGLKISFQPNATAVPLPAPLILFLSGLGVLLGWQRRTAHAATSPGDDAALTI